MLSLITVIVSTTGTVLVSLATALMPVINAKIAQKTKSFEIKSKLYQETYLETFHKLCDTFAVYIGFPNSDNRAEFISAIAQSLQILDYYGSSVKQLLEATISDDLENVKKYFNDVIRNLSYEVRETQSKIYNKCKK